MATIFGSPSTPLPVDQNLRLSRVEKTCAKNNWIHVTSLPSAAHSICTFLTARLESSERLLRNFKLVFALGCPNQEAALLLLERPHYSGVCPASFSSSAERLPSSTISVPPTI